MGVREEGVTRVKDDSGGSAVSLADGSDVSLGAIADAAATAGSTGTAQAKLRLITSQLDSIKTAVELLDNAIAGAEVQVDVVTLPAITGSVTANAGTNLNTSALATSAKQDTLLTELQLKADLTETQPVSLASVPSHAVTNAGTFAVQATAVGTIADDATTPGAPVMVGGDAKSPDGTDPGNVSAENDVVRATFDLNRRQYVNTRHAWTWSYHENSSSALTDASVQAAPAAGFQIVITEIMFSTGAATACNIFFEEGASTILGPWYLEAVAGRGLFWRGEKKITAATALTVTTSAAIAHGLDVQGYIQKV